MFVLGNLPRWRLEFSILKFRMQAELAEKIFLMPNLLPLFLLLPKRNVFKVSMLKVVLKQSFF